MRAWPSTSEALVGGDEPRGDGLSGEVALICLVVVEDAVAALVVVVVVVVVGCRLAGIFFVFAGRPRWAVGVAVDAGAGLVLLLLVLLLPVSSSSESSTNSADLNRSPSRDFRDAAEPVAGVFFSVFLVTLPVSVVGVDFGFAPRLEERAFSSPPLFFVAGFVVCVCGMAAVAVALVAALSAPGPSDSLPVPYPPSS